jgi:starch synthase
MACETPVVASGVGGILDIVVDGETGLLVDFQASSDAYGTPADPAGFELRLAEAVNRVLGDPDLARRMGRAGRERVVREFSWSAVARQTAALYAELSEGT